MAYMNQERKEKIAARLKPILAQYGVKATLSVRNHSTIVLKITSAPIDFIGIYNRILKDKRPDLCGVERDYMDVNPYHFNDQYDGEALDFLTAAFDALNLIGDADANFDKSDSQSDYFHVGWYVDLDIGRFQKPFVVIAKAA